LARLAKHRVSGFGTGRSSADPEVMFGVCRSAVASAVRRFACTLAGTDSVPISISFAAC
jgi:hypothetical protein